jgi:signal transduction histidine kinase
MRKSTIKKRLAARYAQVSLIIFILSLGLYQLIRPGHSLIALLFACAFFAGLSFLAAYILAALELWPFKTLSESGTRDDKGGWADLPDETDVPEEVEDVRRVLRALKDKMDEAVTSQRRFLADASHEMRSPITIMKGNIEIALRRERDPEEYRQVLRSNLEDIDRLEYLLKDLMFLARTDANELVVNMAPVQLGEVIAEVYAGLTPMSRTKGINLSMEINPPEGSEIEGDADRLRQLFINLVVNALRYTPEGGKVDIALNKIAGVSEVTVTDTGIGIPEAELPRIFDRFYRVDKARARESGGTGLGLCICKWIVDTHLGDITIESKEGAGTKVTVMFI